MNMWKYEKRRKNAVKVKDELQTMSAESHGPSYGSGKLFND